MSGGDSIVTYDIAAGGAYPNTGKVPAGVMYVSPNATTAPTPVTPANPFPVVLQESSNVIGHVVVDSGAVTATLGSTDTTNLASVATNTAALVTTTDFGSRIGSLTETAPASDTASSGLNGRLQRVAQRLTSLIGLIPGLGRTTMSASLPVTIASDQAALPVSGTVAISNTSFIVAQTTGSNLHTVVDSGTITLGAGSAIVGKVGIDQTATGTTNAVVPIASTTGGYTPFHFAVSAATTNLTQIKGTAGVISSICVGSTAAYAVAVKFYNLASASVTVGTSTIVRTVMCPAGGGNNVSFSPPLAFSIGISFSITKLIADNDTTAVAIGDATVDVAYL